MEEKVNKIEVVVSEQRPQQQQQSHNTISERIGLGLGNGVLLVEPSVQQQDEHSLIDEPIRFLKVDGHEGRQNDILYCKPLNPLNNINENEGSHIDSRRKRTEALVFFGGDIQDFQEIMESSRDHINYINWNLEITAKMLQAQFPNHHIIVIRPSRIHMYTFSCFDNFVPSNNTGVPDHTPWNFALQHLEALLKSLSSLLYKHSLLEATIKEEVVATTSTNSDQSQQKSQTGDVLSEDTKNSRDRDEESDKTVSSSTESSSSSNDLSSSSTTSEDSEAIAVEENHPYPNSNGPSRPATNKTINYHFDRAKLSLVGFSKGCVVLNQLLYEFHYLKTLTPDDDLMDDFLTCISELYFLDGGHNGGKNTWITARSLLETLVRLGAKIHVHVTPYQLFDDRRPWIRKEEKVFSDTLMMQGAPFSRKVHFENEPPSLDLHLQILTKFGSPEFNEILNNQASMMNCGPDEMNPCI